MQSFKQILARGQLAIRDDDSDGLSSSGITAMIALLCLVFVGLGLVGILMMLRRAKKQRRERELTLPQYEKRNSMDSVDSLEGIRAMQNSNNNSNIGHNPRGLTIQTSDANGRRSLVIFNRDGQPMLANPESPPYSPDNVPEIRITFPDEADENGRPKSGRVVVVRVGDTSIGMEPLAQEEEQLPAYEKESKSQFYSIDIDQIGGLKEKSEYH